MVLVFLQIQVGTPLVGQSVGELRSHHASVGPTNRLDIKYNHMSMDTNA